MTSKQRQLITYIEEHGQRANAWHGDPTLLEVHCHNQHGQEYSEVIPALWTRVRDWLGY